MCCQAAKCGCLSFFPSPNTLICNRWCDSSMSTCVFYVDEAGTPYPHHIPLKNGETPIFTLAALAFPLNAWRARDREYLDLKRHYFPDRMNREGKRDEHVEIKGNELTAPRNASSQRKHAFLRSTLSFIKKHEGIGFCVSFLKNHIRPAPHKSIYTQSLQILVERFSTFIEESSTFENGILICDSRSRGLSGEENLTVIKSHMSFIFGHCRGKTYTNIMEAPLFADSKLCAGIQLSDIFASSVYTNHYHFHINSPSEQKPENSSDYSHMQIYWPEIKSIFFNSRKKTGGYVLHGDRVIDHRPVNGTSSPDDCSET